MALAHPATDYPGFGEGKSFAFSTTHWREVLTAGKNDLAGGAAAMERLCRRYWYPIYAFVRRRGWDWPEAEDLICRHFAAISS